jgi:hypothetical protein
MKYVISLLNKEKRYLRNRLNEANLLNLDEETKEIMCWIAQISNAIQILKDGNKVQDQNDSKN